MSLDELRAQKETLKEPYPVGDYKVMVNLGEEGYFSDGKCGAVPSGKIANCFNDTTITVFNSDGERQFNSRQLPLQVGIYTKEEIDDLMKKMQADMTKMQVELTKKIDESGGITLTNSNSIGGYGHIRGLNGSVSNCRLVGATTQFSHDGGSRNYSPVITFKCPNGSSYIMSLDGYSIKDHEGSGRQG